MAHEQQDANDSYSSSSTNDKDDHDKSNDHGKRNDHDKSNINNDDDDYNVNNKDAPITLHVKRQQDSASRRQFENGGRRALSGGGDGWHRLRAGASTCMKLKQKMSGRQVRRRYTTPTRATIIQ